jgi:hypothetical protein
MKESKSKLKISKTPKVVKTTSLITFYQLFNMKLKSWIQINSNKGMELTLTWLND